MAKTRSNRVTVTVNHEMTVALEILAAQRGVGIATVATMVLRQGLDRTIGTDAAQLRIKQDAAFRTRDQWLKDQQTDTFVANALKVDEGTASEGPPV